MNVLFANSIRMFGGGEIWMLRAARALEARGHRVEILCRPGVEFAGRAEAAGLGVVTLPMAGDFDPRTVEATRRILRRRRVDLVLTNMDKELRFAGMAARLAGRTAVVARRGIDHPLKDALRYRFAYNVLADAVIANSEATRRALLRNAPWLAPEKIRVIYNGIDPAPYEGPPATDIRKRWPIAPGHAVIGFVGQLDERKGIADLLAAFERVMREAPGTTLLLVGEGPLRAEIERFAAGAATGGRVILAGFQDGIADIMKQIDVLVLPSLWEGFGIVLIEAMAASKPAITTAVSSMPEIVLDGETGRVVPVRDPGALAAAMLEVLRDPARGRRWGEAGRRRVEEHFGIGAMTDRLEALFDEVVRQKARR